MRIKKIYLLFFIFYFLFSKLVWAQTVKNKNKSELTVEADESLEWFEKEKYYMAKGNVVLKKDGVTLKADNVKADYVFENGENILQKITAKEKVILTNKKTKATGRNMIYNFKKKVAKISGPFQTFSSPSGYLESNKIIIFDDLNNKAEASGKVKIVLSNKTIIYADTVTADFEPKDKSLNKAIASGNVIIENTSKKRKSKANIGVYNSKSHLIELSGDVIIINQDSVISGSKGVTNLKTGISNIIGDPKNKKRVKGTFAPIKKQNTGDKTD